MNKQDRLMRKSWKKEAEKLAGRDLDKLINDHKLAQAMIIKLNKIITRQKVILIILVVGVCLLFPWVIL